MNSKNFDIPVLLIIFNRPETTCHVFAQIRKIKPSKLYIFSDAPRANFPADNDLVDTCRYLTDDSQINWECDVERWSSDTNMGNGLGISSAITWAFETCEKLIILEDDCLPHPTFFTFCKIMLEKYEFNERVMHVSGTHWDGRVNVDRADHFFSRIGHIWGWATWKRAWNKYDFWMEQFPEMKSQKKIQKLFNDEKVASYWNDRLDKVYNENRKETWNYQWQYTLFQNYGLAAIPNVNLITNIGLDEADGSSDLSRIDNEREYQFYETKVWKSIKNDAKLIIDDSFEKYRTKTMQFKNLSVRSRILNRFRSLLKISF